MTAPQWMSMADPIHGLIRLSRQNPDHQLLLEVMNSKIFQRLRRIKQMGLAEFVFPGATHSRFVHSIGSAWLMVKTLEQLQENDSTRELLKSTYEDTGVTLERLLLLSILLHDIGHTPLSHTLEDILDLKDQGMLHDTYWNKLIIGYDPELLDIWAKYNPEIPKAIFRFNGLEPNVPRHFLSDLVSSQLDMDRLDYLLRDSHFLGVQYGRVEIERIITNLVVGKTPEGQPAIAVREETIPAIEHYLFGRYEAYKMALHSLDKASEALLKKTLYRFKWVVENNMDPGHPAELLYQFITQGKTLSVEDYLMFDDCYLWDKINLWARYSQDPLLKQLANRMLGHDLFKFIEINNHDEFEVQDVLHNILPELKQHYESRGLSFEFGFEDMALAPRPMYQPPQIKPPIWVRRRSGGLVDLAQISTLPLYQNGHHGKRYMIFVWDKEAKDFLRRLLDKSRMSGQLVANNTQFIY